MSDLLTLQDENTRLRAALAQSSSACVYCSLPAEQWNQCEFGFPGCGRSDDAMGCPELGAKWRLEGILNGFPMEIAPHDRPILAYCNHEADQYIADQEKGTLTLYAAHCEGLSAAPTGFHIIEWGGSFDDSTWEYPNQAWLPDWWFVVGSEFECAANPVRWWDLPRVPSNP